MTNWKASGPDCVQGYWFKRFSSLHCRLTKHLQACVAVGDVATWMTKRKTALPICYYHATNEFQSEPTIYNLPECQGTPFSKQGSYLKFKWQQRDSNPQQLSSYTNTHPFSQTGLMIELSCEYLSVRGIWMYIIIISRTSFRVNLQYIVCLNVKKLLAWSRDHTWSSSDSNMIRTQNHLVRKETLNYLCKLAK